MLKISSVAVAGLLAPLFICLMAPALIALAAIVVVSLPVVAVVLLLAPPPLGAAPAAASQVLSLRPGRPTLGGHKFAG
jgi:hypothetical protein